MSDFASSLALPLPADTVERLVAWQAESSRARATPASCRRRTCTSRWSSWARRPALRPGGDRSPCFAQPRARPRGRCSGRRATGRHGASAWSCSATKASARRGSPRSLGEGLERLGVYEREGRRLAAARHRPPLPPSGRAFGPPLPDLGRSVRPKWLSIIQCCGRPGRSTRSSQSVPSRRLTP